MATASKDKTESTESTGILPQMEEEDSLNGLPLRGRGFSSEVNVIKEALQKCLADGTIRSFPNIDPKDKEKYARLIRRAGDAVNIPVATRHDKDTLKMYWGPEEVMKKIASGNSGS